MRLLCCKYSVFVFNFSIYTATWNVNSKSPGDVDLRPWLSALSRPPDIYAIGIQELDLSAKAIALNKNEPDRVWM